ncbi:MAG TPA: NUDIX domain-containing protein [Puia sp.]|nr:NUDIX domain-containing protein [Puia sp.]
MVTRQSAGILLYRQNPAPADASRNPAPANPANASRDPASPAEAPTNPPEVFLVHPGGPYWKNKDAGTWTIPKGEFLNDEPALDAAIREFREETGVQLKGFFKPLSPIRQKGGKHVYAWALAGDLDPKQLVSNTFDLEWPRGSGRMKTFPEVDRGAWCTLDAARAIINPAQIAFLDELAEIIKTGA